MPRHVVAVVGENANGILACQSERFMALLHGADTQCHVLDLGRPDFLDRLVPLLAEGVAFAWGYAGVGARLTAGGQNLWDSVATPFISVLADPPYVMPVNHRVASRYVVNAYVYGDWLDMQQRLFRAPQVSAKVPMGVLPNPHRHDIAWADRSRRMVLVKAGGDPAAQRARWARWPALAQAVLNDSAALLCASGTGTILPVVLDCLHAHGVALDGRPDLLFGLLHELDSWLRAHRATVLARALRPLPVDIIGDGWDHVSATPGRARFLPAMHAAGLEALYADTQYLLNANPNLYSGLHERVLRGFAAGCCVVSDDNDFSRGTLAGIPSYFGLEWNDPALPSHLAAIHADPTDRTHDRAAADEYVAQHHDPAVFLGHLARLAELVRSTEQMSCYALDAA